jgi:glutamate-5-semialdehyde dehydrogenase
VSAFYDAFARRLADDASFAPVAAANAEDVAAARARGRSTTRLELGPAMRAGMVEALHLWRDLPDGRDAVEERIEHPGWTVEARRSPLGVVGFVFEGRPNVFADATGVLRSGNTVVFRIGSDALGTARAIVEHALAPALAAVGLPDGAVVLVDSAARSAGWALFADRRLALAVARGSGPAVAQLGAVARQAGTPVSLHGTGGAWLVAGLHAEPRRFAAAVRHSLDRKVCNTLNVCCIPIARADELVPVLLESLDEAGRARGSVGRLHVVAGSEAHVPPERFTRRVVVHRAEGATEEPYADVLPESMLGHEWEWEGSPEITLVVTASVADAVELANRYSPRFVASLVSDDPAEQEWFWASVDAPFVGDGFTRWVDGQYALGRPELGLSNWQHGRLFARSGVLSGDSVYTVRLRVRQDDPDLRR